MMLQQMGPVLSVWSPLRRNETRFAMGAVAKRNDISTIEEVEVFVTSMLLCLMCRKHTHPPNEMTAWYLHAQTCSEYDQPW